MSEKRFKKGDWTNCRYDICEIIDEDDEVVCIVSLKDADKVIAILEENEQLKEERNYFERKKCEYFNKYNKKHLDNIQLKEENEQLKKRVDKLKVIMAEFGATLLMNGFDIEVDGKDLMEMINNE